MRGNDMAGAGEVIRENEDRARATVDANTKRYARGETWSENELRGAGDEYGENDYRRAPFSRGQTMTQPTRETETVRLYQAIDETIEQWWIEREKEKFPGPFVEGVDVAGVLEALAKLWRLRQTAYWADTADEEAEA